MKQAIKRINELFVVFILTLHIHPDWDCLEEVKKLIVYICDTGKEKHTKF